MRQLSEGAEAQACIAFDLPVTKSMSTHHFRVLREAGVITQHYRGNKILNQLRAGDLETRFPGLLQAILTAEQPTGTEPDRHPTSTPAGGTT